MPIESKVAPRDLIQADFRNLRSNERLDTTPRIEEIVFIQSMEGRAHNGAGSFHKRFYVNTSIDDIVRALDRDTGHIKARRQELIDEIKEFVERVIAGEHPERLLSRKGTPLLGIPLFKNRIVKPRDVVRGLYLGGLRDCPEIRSEAEKKYGVTIGYGRCYLINKEVMERMGLDGDVLAHQEHAGRIGELEKEGLIVKPELAGTVDGDTLRYFYIRHKLGPGQSDDAAIVASGILYKSVDVALGVFLADAIDTLEKYAPVYADQDNELGYFIKENFKDLGVTDDQVYELAYLAAIPEGKEEEVPDSSLRYLLTIDPRTGQSTLESHLNFIEGKPFFPMAISYKRILITTFYEYLKGRLSAVTTTTTEELLAFAGIGKGLDVPLRNIMKTKIAVVDQDSRLSDVLKELREKDIDAIIVQDGERNILGVVDPEAILHIFERKE